VKENIHWAWQILRTELNLKHKITVFITLDVTVLVYSFGIVNWLRKEVEKIDQTLRKQLTTENQPSGDRE
jgi:hypothetical protein